MRNDQQFLRYLIIVLLLCSVYPTFLSAQSPRLDSLLKVVNTLPEDTNKANILNEIGRTYLKEFNDLAKVGEYGWKELPLARKLNYKKGIAQAMINIAITYNTISINYDLALYYNRTALKLAQEIGNKKIESIALANIGLTFSEKGDYAEALDYMERSQEIRTAIGDKRGIAIGNTNMANIYQRQGNFPKAMNLQLEGLKIREELGDRAGMVPSCCNVGALLAAQERFDEALGYYLKAIQIREADHIFGQTIVYGNIGTVYIRKKDFKKALMYMQKELELNEQMGDKQGVALAYMDIASVYAAENNPDVALVYQLKSYALSKEIGDKGALIRISGPIANSYAEKNDLTNAMSYNLKMLALCKETGNKESMAEAYSNLASVYKKQKQYEKALEYTELYNAMKDSLLNKENFKQVTELNTRYETEKKEKEILLLTKDQQLNARIIRQQQLVRWGLIGGLVLLCISIFSIYRRYHFKQKANIILEKQKEEIQQKNMLITDSIDYAKTIQEAVLPTAQEVKNLFPESFIFYKPKAIVSGDFYWINTQQERLVCAVADCIGHGVPGAFMSLLGYNMLEDAVQNLSTSSPGAVLDMLNQRVIQRFTGDNKEESVKHGMDISLISIDTTTHRLEFSGAHNSLYIVRSGELMELKADKTGIGTNRQRDNFFHDQQIELQKGDMVYLFTDGFPDQMGGPNRKKFYYPPFKALLKTISSLEPEHQREKLDQAHTQWRGNKIEQTDDILIIGIRY